MIKSTILTSSKEKKKHLLSKGGLRLETTLKKQRAMQMKQDWQLYFLLILPLIWLFLFCYTPMIGLIMAFKRYQPVKGILGSSWVGLFYFERFLKSPQFSRVILNTVGISIYNLVAGFPFPIILALAFNATKRNSLKKVTQLVSYMPYFISTVVIVGMILQVFNPHIGIYSKVREILGFSKVNLLADPNYFKSLYVWSGVWQTAGWGTIIYLAVLSSVSASLHEAAIIDGASRFQRIIYIDIPALIPTIIILLILNAGQIMNIGFEKIFLMQNPLNLSSSEVISTYTYKIGLASSLPDYSYGTAIGFFLSFINLSMMLFVNLVANKLGETSLW